MRTKLAAASLCVAVVVLAAGPAYAKGPSGGTIEGEGLSTPIVVGMGEGTPGGDQLINDVGFFDATFGQLPTHMLDEAPTSDLGPMLTIRWNVPGPDGADDVIVQYLYPYADGGPVVYTEPGQTFFTTERTKGGWFRAPSRLLTTLQELGLPALDKLESSSSSGGTSWTRIGASVGSVVLLGAGLALLSRRRGEVAPAAG